MERTNCSSNNMDTNDDSLRHELYLDPSEYQKFRQDPYAYLGIIDDEDSIELDIRVVDEKRRLVAHDKLETKTMMTMTTTGFDPSDTSTMLPMTTGQSATAVHTSNDDSNLASLQGVTNKNASPKTPTTKATLPLLQPHQSVTLAWTKGGHLTVESQDVVSRAIRDRCGSGSSSGSACMPKLDVMAAQDIAKQLGIETKIVCAVWNRKSNSKNDAVIQSKPNTTAQCERNPIPAAAAAAALGTLDAHSTPLRDRTLKTRFIGQRVSAVAAKSVVPISNTAPESVSAPVTPFAAQTTFKNGAAANAPRSIDSQTPSRRKDDPEHCTTRHSTKHVDDHSTSASLTVNLLSPLHEAIAFVSHKYYQTHSMQHQQYDHQGDSVCNEAAFCLDPHVRIMVNHLHYYLGAGGSVVLRPNDAVEQFDQHQDEQDEQKSVGEQTAKAVAAAAVVAAGPVRLCLCHNYNVHNVRCQLFSLKAAVVAVAPKRVEPWWCPSCRTLQNRNHWLLVKNESSIDSIKKEQSALGAVVEKDSAALVVWPLSQVPDSVASSPLVTTVPPPQSGPTTESPLPKRRKDCTD